MEQSRALSSFKRSYSSYKAWEAASLLTLRDNAVLVGEDGVSGADKCLSGTDVGLVIFGSIGTFDSRGIDGSISSRSGL